MLAICCNSNINHVTRIHVDGCLWGGGGHMPIVNQSRIEPRKGVIGADVESYHLVSQPAFNLIPAVWFYWCMANAIASFISNIWESCVSTYYNTPWCPMLLNLSMRTPWIMTRSVNRKLKLYLSKPYFQERLRSPAIHWSLVLLINMCFSYIHRVVWEQYQSK